MPSVAQEAPAVQSSKKRRRDDNSHQMPSFHSAATTARGILTERALDLGGLFPHHHHASHLAARKIMPSPPGKRQRTTVDIDIEACGEPMQRSPPSSPSRGHDHHQHEQRQQHQQHQQREHKQTKDASREQRDQETRVPPPTTTSLMSRCHICSRKPNKKSDLDSFADCQGCGQRTCYVCIRACLGWGPNIGQQTATPVVEEEGETSFTMLDADAEDGPPPPQPATETPRIGHGHGGPHEHGWTRGGGHRQVVCSRCCVEKGQDGDVVCLGCLPFVEG